MSGTLTSAGGRSRSRSRASRPKNGGPVAIVDIGSNSVRLVIYEQMSRTRRRSLHNEKAICAIGRNMVTTGRLHEEGIALALEALGALPHAGRRASNVEMREAVATAAARDAANGEEFVRRAEAAWGGPIRVLSGEEEARLAAEGVLAGIPDADGLVADLGGGSLDMVTVSKGKTGDALTLPFGPLRLMDIANGDPDKARKLVDDGLSTACQFRRARRAARSMRWAACGAASPASTWRRANYPLHVLHELPRSRARRALRLCKALVAASRANRWTR